MKDRIVQSFPGHRLASCHIALWNLDVSSQTINQSNYAKRWGTHCRCHPRGVVLRASLPRGTPPSHVLWKCNIILIKGRIVQNFPQSLVASCHIVPWMLNPSLKTYERNFQWNSSDKRWNNQKPSWVQCCVVSRCPWKFSPPHFSKTKENFNMAAFVKGWVGQMYFKSHIASFHIVF